MSKTAHTRGPWHNTPDSGEIAGPDGEYVARAILGGVTPEGAANARLIAAAPCLLEALESCLNYIENSESWMGETLDCGNKARAAIARAKGGA